MGGHARLPLADLHEQREVSLELGYWCEILAIGPPTDNAPESAWWIGCRATGSPAAALRWLRGHATHIAAQLNAPAMNVLEGWRADVREQERAIARLADGDLYSLVVPDEGLRLLFSVRPTRPSSRAARHLNLASAVA